jgi:pimeloyl-ACP methyl ester carboxylesterase
MPRPEPRHAKSGDGHVACQVTGAPPRGPVLVPGWVSNIEVLSDEPACARFLERLASSSRLILFDQRDTGLSDRATDVPNLARGANRALQQSGLRLEGRGLHVPKGVPGERRLVAAACAASPP